MQKPTENNKAIRIAFVAGSLALGGAEKQFFYLLQALRETKIEFRVYTLTRGEHFEKPIRDSGITPVWIGKEKNRITRIRALIKDLSAFQPEIIQSTHFFANFYAGLSGRLTGIQSIGAIRSDTVYELKKTGLPGHLLLRLPTYLLTNTEKARKSAIRPGIPEDRIFVLPNVIDIPAFDKQQTLNQADLRRDQQRFEIVSVGRLIDIKRFERFIAVIEAVRRTKPNVRGKIIGSGPEKEKLIRLAKQKGIFGSHLLFPGERNDIPQILSESDCFLLTSDHEGFPNAVLEAMAARLPVIATPAGDLERILTDQKNGFLVDYDDIERMTALVISLMENESLRTQIGNAARKSVEEFYSFDGLAEKALRLYERLVSERV